MAEQPFSRPLDVPLVAPVARSRARRGRLTRSLAGQDRRSRISWGDLGRGKHPPPSLGGSMDFTLTPEQQSFRDEVRSWLGKNLPEDWVAKLRQSSDVPRPEAY